MKASAIRIDVSEIATLDRAVPPVAIATATIKFQLSGDLSSFEDKSGPAKERLLAKMLLEALREIEVKEKNR